MSTNVSYKSSIYGLIDVQNGSVGVGSEPRVFKTTEAGVELGRKLVFTKRPLGVGAETEVLGSNAAFVLDENIPASYIHIDAPSNSSNVWIMSVDGEGVGQYELVTAVHVDANGYVYSATEYDASLSSTFRNPDGSTFMVPDLYYDSNIYNFAVVSSFEANGKPKWFRVIGTSNYIIEDCVYVPSVTSDSAGNAYLAGYSATVTNVFDGNLNLWWNSAYTYDVNDVNDGSYGGGGYIVKYDTNGTPLWASYVTSPHGVRIHRNAIDETSNALYVSGDVYINEPGDLLKFYNANGTISSNAIYPSGDYGMVGTIMKLSTDGNLLWVNRVDGINEDSITQLVIDNNHAIVFASKSDGTSANSITMQSQDENDMTIPGLNSVIIGKYSSEGIPVWGVNIGSSTGEVSLSSTIQSIATNTNNDVFVIWEASNEEISITNSDGTTNTISVLDYCSLLMKFSSAGVYQWHVSITGTQVNYTITSGLAIDSLNNLYVACSYGDHLDTTIINADNSSNVLHVDGSHTSGYRSHILQFNADGQFVRNIAHIDGDSGNQIFNMVIDENRRRLYLATYGNSAFSMYNASGDNTYSLSNLDSAAGFLIGLNMETGNPVPTGVHLTLPAQQTDNFRKNIFLTTENGAPYTTTLDLQNRDGSFKTVPVTLDQSNVTVQKSFRWTSNSWVAESQFEPTANGVNLVSYYYGDQSFDASGSNFIGSTIAWQNKVIDNKMAFRVTTKCSLASDEEIAYRQFEALVSPVDNFTSNMPYGIVSAEIGDTYGTVFSDLNHTITRNSDRSVDLKVGWNTNSSNYIGNIELHVLASTRLGDITFDPIHG